MADTFTHGAATGWAAKILGLLLYFLFGIEPFDPTWLLTAVLGATLIDVCTDPFCWIARHKRFGHSRSFIVSMKYDGLLTKELRILETERAISIQWYHFLHSYWVATLTTTVVLVLWGPYIASAWATGYFLHVALDEGTHEKLEPFLPLKLRLFRTGTNWWQLRWDLVIFGWSVTIAWTPHVYYLSVPTALGGIYHLCQLHGIVP